MKLSDFNTEDLKRMQQAIKDTRAKYDGYRDHQIPKHTGGPCPLCFFTDIMDDECRSCPWTIFELPLYDEYFHDNPCLEKSFMTEKTFTRRNRLDRWHNLIEEEIRRRG